MRATVTIHDVAKKAGVSPATVSRVLNNNTSASSATTLKVRKAMVSIGYKSIPVNQRKGHRSRKGRPGSYRKMQVALISRMRPYLMEVPIYAKVMRGIEAELGEHYYNLIIRNLPEHSPWEAIPKKIDGAILFNVNTENIKLLRELRSMPCVRIMGPTQENDFFDHVTYNDYSVGKRAAEYLLEKKHKRILYLGPQAAGSLRDRRVAFQETVKEAGIALDVIENNNLVDESSNMQLPDVKEIGKEIQRIKQLPEMPTAIYAPMDIIVIGLYHTLHHYGIIPGQDVELIGVNNDAIFINNCNPRPASVDIHPEKVGREAVKRLFWRMDNPKEPLMKIELEPEIAMQ